MRIIYSPDRGRTRSELKPEQLGTALEDDGAILWLDLDGDDSEEVRAILADTFGFHPLAIDDTLNETHLPKVDDWGRYLFLVLRGASYKPERQRVLLPEVDVFLGDNFLVTYHEAQLSALDEIWSGSFQDERLLHNGPAYLLYRLIGTLVNDFLAVIGEMEDSVELIEKQVLEKHHPQTQAAIMRMKHSILQIRRVLSLQREVLNRLSRDPFTVLDEEERLYFRDVYDHLLRLYDMADGIRDLIMGAMDIYLSVANNRMNDIMRTLTVITTLFMPITFLTGFFGMNFFEPSVETLKIWTGPVSFVFTLLIMALLPFVMYIWMRRRAWME